MISRRLKEKYRKASKLKPGMEVRKKDGEWCYIMSHEINENGFEAIVRLVDGTAYSFNGLDLVMSR